MRKLVTDDEIFKTICCDSDHDIFGRGAASFASAARSGQYLWHGATVDIFDDGHHQAGTGEGDRYIFN